MNKMNKSYYIQQAFRNLQNLSRTAKGIVDVSASSDKAKVFRKLTSKQALDRTLFNFSKTINFLYSRKNIRFSSAEDLQRFIEDIAFRINKGVLKPNFLIRRTDSEKHPYTKIKFLKKAMNQFYNEMFKRLLNKKENSKKLAAWLIYRIDLSNHFFADGCGKTSLAVSSWILIRANLPLPKYHSREEFYKHAPKHIRGSNSKIDYQEFARWTKYYLSLFK